MKYEQMPTVCEVMDNNKHLSRWEVREAQDFISATSCDNDDEILDEAESGRKGYSEEEFNSYGIREISEGELITWSMLDGGSISLGD